MNLMDRMKVASDLQNMTMGERLFGSIQVAIFGIAIVFVALLLLFVIIMVLEKLLYNAEGKQTVAAKKDTAPEAPAKAEEVEEETEVEDTQLVAVITAAVAASLHTSTHNIVVKNIVRVPDTTPAWNKLGRMQQLNRME